MMRGFHLLVCVALSYFLYAVVGQNGNVGVIPRTSFSCAGRASGYYADMETGCQVYHMCDGLGRQFSYSCPNTTLFQQRMLICDHWYMVNCSMSARDYDANLLIGQRDKPFVTEEEMGQRTPRPDVLSIPLNSNYYEGLKEAESKYSSHSGNSIVGNPDTITGGDNDDLDSDKYYRPPTSWSTRKPITTDPTVSTHIDIFAGVSQKPTPTVAPTVPTTLEYQTTTEASRQPAKTIPPPSRHLNPPLPPTTEASSEEFQIDVRMKEDPVVDFIKRFDPKSRGAHKTSMTKTEIININKQLPEGQVSSEDERAPRKNKNFDNNLNQIESTKGKGGSQGSRVDNVNVKPTVADDTSTAKEPSRLLEPPKTDFLQLPSTTEGPAIYYEWKWAVPAFDLEPPKLNNETSNVKREEPKDQGRNPFRNAPVPTPADIEPTPGPTNTEYNISSYFVPDYIFPLDKPHPGYEDDDAKTSFQVTVSRQGRASYGENPACPQCHPAYVEPGTCEPCIVER